MKKCCGKYNVDVEDRTYYESLDSEEFMEALFIADAQEAEKTLLIPEEFNDYLKVMEPGAKKHGLNSWLEPNGPKSSHKDMAASIFRHVAEGYAGKTADPETGEHPYLHAITRLNMAYTRWKRGIKHKDD